MKTIFYTIITSLCTLLVFDAFAQSKNALIFDGTDDYIDCTNRSDMEFDGTKSFTIEAWVKKNGGSGSLTILSKYNDGVEGTYTFGITTGNAVFLTRNAGAPVTVTSVTQIPNHLTSPPGKYLYSHVAATYDGTDVKLYINGVLDVTMAMGSASSAPNTNVLIGASYVSGSPANFMWGQIEELRVWNVARTQTELYNNRFKEIKTSETGLVAYFKCNEGTGTSLTDSKAAISGTLINGTDWIASSVNLTTSNPGNALHFDPTHNPGIDVYGDYATLYDNYKFTTQSFTLQGSVYPTGASTPPHGTIFSRENEYWVTRWNDGTLQVALNNVGPGWSWMNTGLVLPENTWTDFTVIYDRSLDELRVYINGTDQSYTRTGTTGDIGGTAPAFFIGGYFNGTDYFFNGAVDEVRIWDHVRTPAQIKAARFTTVDPNTPGLLGYYRFDEGNAGGNNTGIAAISDLTANKNDGAMGRYGPDGIFSKFALTGSTSNFIKGMQYNSWTGATSTDWTISSNWGLDAVPTSTDNVSIQVGADNLPTLSSAQTVKHLFLEATTTVTANANLNVTGNVYNYGTINGTNPLVLNGTGSQTINGTGTLNHLTVDNSNTTTINDNTTLKGTLLVNTGSTLNTGGLLTLKSDASGTARVGNSAGTITGDVTVERYIANPQRSWHMLSAQTTTGAQTIKQAWQENGGPIVAGQGTLVTSPAYNGSNGFDASSIASSILIHDQSVPSWYSIPVTNTDATALSSRQGYMLFVRGDRNYDANNSPATSSTVLRSKGTLQQGNVNVAIPASANYMMVGNPYASPVDMEPILADVNIDDEFMVWDPALSGNFGVGGYRAVVRTGANAYNQTPVVLGGTVNNDPTIQFVHSGQAIFMKSAGGGTAAFTEAAKAASPTIVFNPIVNSKGDQQILANLMVVQSGAGAYLADGIRVMYNKKFKADISDDIIKIGKYDENVSSFRQGKKLIVERRPMITGGDTIFLKMTNASAKKYRFQVGTIDFVQANVIAYLQDTYLNTDTKLDLTGEINNIDFIVTADPASANQDRFRIVFSLTAPSTVSFTNLFAKQQGDNVNVDWQVTNQVYIVKYEVERSVDGISFVSVASKDATGANGSDVAYSWIDANPAVGNNYYRIRSVGNDGAEKVSEQVLVKISKGKPEVTVFPNPVINRNMGLQFINMEKGNYQVRITNNMGQVLYTKAIAHTGGTATQYIVLDKNITTGTYQLEVLKPDNSKSTLSVLIAK